MRLYSDGTKQHHCTDCHCLFLPNPVRRVEKPVYTSLERRSGPRQLRCEACRVVYWRAYYARYRRERKAQARGIETLS